MEAALRLLPTIAVIPFTSITAQSIPHTLNTPKQSLPTFNGAPFRTGSTLPKRKLTLAQLLYQHKPSKTRDRQ